METLVIVWGIFSPQECTLHLHLSLHTFFGHWSDAGLRSTQCLITRLLYPGASCIGIRIEVGENAWSLLLAGIHTWGCNFKLGKIVTNTNTLFSANRRTAANGHGLRAMRIVFPPSLETANK